MTKAGIAFGLCCCAIVQLAAQTASDKPASVEGIVTDSVTGAPVIRAHVTLQGRSSDEVDRRYGATTGADGKFSISGIEPGSFLLTSERVGFVAIDKSPQVTLKAGDSKTDIEVKLTPTGTILGRVTDPDGEPVQGASVEAANAAYAVASRTTDERGQFRLGGLMPGKYFVRASWNNGSRNRPEIRTEGTAETNTAMTWYPGVLTRAEATRAEVKPGAESTGIEIQLLKTPFVRVSGKVLGMPASRGRDSGFLTVWHEDSGTGAPLKPDGSFEVWRLSPGRYRLKAEWQSATGQKVQTASAGIEIGTANIDNIELRAVPDSNIAGRLEFDDEQAKQFSKKDAFGRHVNFVQIDDQNFSDQQVSVTGDNTFRFDKVPASRYRLSLDWDDAYVRSMSLGSTAIDGAALDLSNGSGGANLVVRLSAATGSIAGTVQADDGNHDDQMVVLTSEDEGFQLRSTEVKADGSYTFAHVPPGSFQIVAVDGFHYDPAGNTLPGFERLMESVDVPAGSKVTRDLKLRMPE
jgi:protocatechuate 3,4-dioxygenase beta subunit